MDVLRVEQGPDFPQRRGRIGVAAAVDAYRAFGGAVEPDDGSHRRGFARAVRAEETGDTTGRDGEAQVVDGNTAAVTLGQVLDLDHETSFGRWCMACAALTLLAADVRVVLTEHEARS